MSQKIIWLSVAVLVIAVSTIIVLRTQTTKSDLPPNITRLDQLNIQTQNPQPAGKNINPGSLNQ